MVDSTKLNLLFCILKIYILNKIKGYRDEKYDRMEL